MDSNESSPTLTASTWTGTATPATSISSSTTLALPTIPLGPLPVTTLSANSWRTLYPQIGQFAMTTSEEVVAAGSRGLFYFKRVRDHGSTPWSEARPLPSTQAMLNNSSVSGLAIHRSKSRLDVYCVSSGVLHSFYCSTDAGSSFVVNPRPPLSTHLVRGSPAVVNTGVRYNSEGRWNLVVPCQSGGLLHTSTTGPSSRGYYSSDKEWEPVDHVAKELGLISAVSITTTQIRGGDEYYGRPKRIDIVAACVASARLHTLEGKFSQEHSSWKWEAQTSTRIYHPGEVTGNPVLVTKTETNQLDLLVPSAEGGVFHFVRTESTPDEWHMIARITFPLGLPAASCLAFNSALNNWENQRQFSALVQSGGRLYQIRTYEGAHPWYGSCLKPIMAPGPFSD